MAQQGGKPNGSAVPRSNGPPAHAETPSTAGDGEALTRGEQGPADGIQLGTGPWPASLCSLPLEGFPPPPDKIITQPDSVYFSFPRLRWSVCHLREFLPTEEISRGLGAPVPLDYPSAAEFADLRQQIDAVTFTPQNSDTEMTWEESLYANYTDGMLIMHRVEVVYERYFGCLEEDGKHPIMSMTKSFTGLLAEIVAMALPA